tara:strand:- start:41334 stop:41795 length:462 start_codon:yes stop_codon:yes gene_type:complete
MKTEDILFRFHSNLFDEEITETITCEVIDHDTGIYRVHGVPFYASVVAPDDLIYAEFNEEEGMITYEETTEHSGSSVVQLVKLEEETGIQELIDLFTEKGCRIEKYSENYFAMEVHYNQDYAPIKELLDELESEKIASYAEPTISEKHLEDCQ